MTMIDGWVSAVLSWAPQWWPFAVEVSVKATVVLLAAATATLALRRSSAAQRHGVLLAALVAVSLLPLTSVALPEWRVVPVLPQPAGEMTNPASVAPVVPAAMVPSARVAPEPATTTSSVQPVVAPSPAPSARSEQGTAVMAAETAPTSPALPMDPSPEVRVGSEVEGEFDAAVSLPALGLGTWLLGVVLGIGFMLAGTVRLVAVEGRALRVTGGPARELLDRLRSELSIRRRVRLLVAREECMPVTWGAFRPRILLPASMHRWDEQRLRHVMLHELSHVSRWDQPVQLLAELLRIAHWPNPLVWWSVKRLREERERACDDRVLAAGCRPSAYAEELLSAARGWSPAPAAATAVPMARRSRLSERLQAILDPGVSRRGPSRRAAWTVGLVAAVVTVPLGAVQAVAEDGVVTIEDGATAVEGPVESQAARSPATEPMVPTTRVVPPAAEVEGRPIEPGTPTWPKAQSALQEVHCVFRSDRGSSNVHSDDRGWDIRWEREDCWLEVTVDREVVFSSDDRAVESISGNGRFEMEDDVDGLRRRVRMEAGSGGQLSVLYWLDGERAEWDAEGRAWVASILPQLFRRTTIDAERRARRILDESGPDGLIAEIERMESDHVAATYLGHLLAMAELSAGQVGSVLNFAARELESDHYLASVLLDVGGLVELSPAHRDAYLDAAATLESDHYHSEVLSGLLDRESLDVSEVAIILDQSAQLDSDHYRAGLLEQIAAEGPLSADLRPAFLRNLRGLESDHYAAGTIEVFLDQGRLTNGELASVLQLAETIDGDHYLAGLLGRVATEYVLTGEAATEYLRLAGSMDSDHYVSEVVSTLLAGTELEPNGYGLAIELMGQMDSDHYIGQTLDVLFDRELDATRIRDVLRVVDGMDSDHEQAEALLRLIDTQELTANLRADVLEVAESIGSSHYRNEVLAELARLRG